MGRTWRMKEKQGRQGGEKGRVQGRRIEDERKEKGG